MKETKTRRILEYIRDNHPCKAKDICEAVLEKRHMPADKYNSKAYSYYVGWSGFRIHLARNWGWQADESKAAILLTKDGYVLTKYGRSLLERR